MRRTKRGRVSDVCSNMPLSDSSSQCCCTSFVLSSESHLKQREDQLEAELQALNSRLSYLTQIIAHGDNNAPASPQTKFSTPASKKDPQSSQSYLSAPIRARVDSRSQRATKPSQNNPRNKPQRLSSPYLHIHEWLSEARRHRRVGELDAQFLGGRGGATRHNCRQICRKEGTKRNCEQQRQGIDLAGLRDRLDAAIREKEMVLRDWNTDRVRSLLTHASR